MAGAEDKSLRGVRFWPEAEGPRERLFEAVLTLAGERGLGEVSLAALCERAGVGNRVLHREFETLEDCFAAAYERQAQALCEELLAIGRAGADWRAGFRAALEAFLAFVAAEPGRSRALLLEWRGAGKRSRELHEQAWARLGRAIDKARHAGDAREDPPPQTARVVLGGIEFMTIERLITGRAESVPELAKTLAFFAVMQYFGEEAARGELG